jgi:hypothetical protein
MWEYPIARAFADARIVKIAGGSMEIMKHIIGRSLFSHTAGHVKRRSRAKNTEADSPVTDTDRAIA